MFRRIKDNLTSRVSPTRQHLSGLRADLRSRMKHFRSHRSVSDQAALVEDFNQVLTAWGIEDVTAIPDTIRVLRFRFLVFAVPVVAGFMAALLLRDFGSCLTLAFISLPCLFGIVSAAWRISILQNRRFLPLSRWMLSGFGFFKERP